MKKTPQMQKLEELLRSGRLVVGGFMKNDNRSLDEVIETDAKALEKTGRTYSELAKRMREITELAKPRLGNWIKVDDNIEAAIEDFRGKIICPWPHPGVFPKRITSVRKIGEERTISWTDLNVHMIEQHRFFEGKGSLFRIEPGELVEYIFKDKVD